MIKSEVENNREINASSLSIEELLLDQKILSIPRYQREYSWGKDNVLTFIHDVCSGYYVGNIIVYNNKEKNIKEIIDGQQRLITTFLILIAVRNKTNNRELKEKIDSLILIENKCKLSIEERIGAHGINLLNYFIDNKKEIPISVKNYNEYINFEIIKLEVDKYIALENLYKNLTQSNVVEISFCKNEISAYEMFVNVNTKGKPLMELEVLKSQLFKYLLNTPAADLYKDKWQEMLKSIPKKEYSNYVSDAYLFYCFDKKATDEKNLKTNGTIKENYLTFLKEINDKNVAHYVFDMMTGNDLESLYPVYAAIKNHDLMSLSDEYYTGKMDASLSQINNLWKMYDEFGFKQSDIMFISILKDKEAFLSNNINYLYTFMMYILLYEISRSITKVSPANYSNLFKQIAYKLNNIKDPSQIKIIIRELVKSLTIDTKKIEIELKKNDYFKKNYKNSKFIILLAEKNIDLLKTTIEHFIPQRKANVVDETLIGNLGNLIPVLKDRYKDKEIRIKLDMYLEDSMGDPSIKNFLEYGFTTENYKEKINERKDDIVQKFVSLIEECYNYLIE